jgi:hypothetical protein
VQALSAVSGTVHRAALWVVSANFGAMAARLGSVPGNASGWQQWQAVAVSGCSSSASCCLPLDVGGPPLWRPGLAVCAFASAPTSSATLSCSAQREAPGAAILQRLAQRALSVLSLPSTVPAALSAALSAAGTAVRSAPAALSASLSATGRALWHLLPAGPAAAAATITQHLSGPLLLQGCLLIGTPRHSSHTVQLQVAAAAAALSWMHSPPLPALPAAEAHPASLSRHGLSSSSVALSSPVSVLLSPQRVPVLLPLLPVPASAPASSTSSAAAAAVPVAGPVHLAHAPRLWRLLHLLFFKGAAPGSKTVAAR